MFRWFRKSKALPIQNKFVDPTPAVAAKPVTVKLPEVKDPAYVVEQIEMSATGIFKIFGRRPKE